MDTEIGSEISERRKSARFRIVLPVELQEGSAVTGDMSLSGVFFETDQPLAPGEPVRLVMVLERVSPIRPIRLECEGRVVRVTRLDGKIGVAVAISAYKFDPSGRPIALT
jgi:hypothetical protein